ncbi:NAD(P)-dependent oxidoreductase [Streptomyces griseosporeus]|uniref:NAD(P)-dependent oxidoreductase n=1 Tax=Streptomyces griseosporeus TaxID=1910 RepID=UPI0036F9C132
MTATTPSPLTVLGTGAMGTALARAWLAAGHPVTVWNRTPSRAEPLAADGAVIAPTAADAVAASRLVVACLLDDASVGAALDGADGDGGADLAGRDLVNLTTGTPGDARSRAARAAERGARYLDGGIMAVPPMIGRPDSGAYVFYSGSAELFAEHRGVLAAVAGTEYVGADPGLAALHDVALLSAMNGMFAGLLHAFALLRGTDVAPRDLAPRLVSWLGAMAPAAHTTAERLETGDYTKDVVSSLAMQAAGVPTFLRTAEEQGVSPELLLPYLDLMRRRAADGHGEEDTAGMVELLVR